MRIRNVATGASEKTCTSPDLGWMRMKITAMTTTTRMVGMRTKGAKIVSLSGTTCPVAFSTRFSALPCEAWESAMELERPLLQTDQAE